MQKNIIKLVVLFLAFICIFYFYKKIQNPENGSLNDSKNEAVYETTLPEDFYTFYDQYHTDSLFQLERTVFPLKGLAKSTDSTRIAEEILWQKNDWILHKPFDDHNGTFQRAFTNMSGIISEQIAAGNGLFTIEKRYAKLGGEWHLIYYQELIMNG